MFRKRGAVIAAVGVLAACLMSLSTSAAGEESPDGGAFLRGGVGPRYLAMGKTGTATATDVHAGYWNPAGLAWMRGWQIAGMYTGGLDFDRKHNYIGVGYGSEQGSIALSWINAGSDIQGTDAIGNPTEVDRDENAILLSLAKSWERLALGASGKLVNQDVDTDSGDDTNTGFGLDVGGSLKVNRYLNLGLVVQDIFTELGDAGETNDVPSQLRVGGTLLPADGFTLAADIHKVDDEDEVKFHGGAEYKFWLSEDLNAAIRAGVDRGRFAGGFGIGVNGLNFDYAYVIEPGEFEGESHRLGVLLKFGGDEAGAMMGGASDRDGDGIPDDVDKCPDQPEDYDGYRDSDGCQDRDNDGDGIPDIQDQCANQAEDLDNFEDSDGCPDLDNDKDGILDVDDKCRNAAETQNGFDDHDGCPDETPISFLRVHINFNFGTAEIAGADPIPTLDEVARILKDHPDIKVEIQGHTDNIGTDESNQILSLKRAQAAKEYLMRQGVPAERMRPAGYGESRPIDTNDTDLGRSRNRRIEFVVFKK
jgi:outer membrane protein OmpA-like peptidoglycan-associated protein